MKSLLIGIKNVILWSYDRGSWQYDVLCLLIIASIFLVPSSFFGDRDRPEQGQAIVSPRLASKAGEKFREIGIEELQLFLKTQKRDKLIESQREALILYLKHELKRDVTNLKYERYENEHRRVAYRVWYQ